MEKIYTSMKRNEVWLVDLNPTIGAEIKKTRPVVIVNDDNIGILPLKVIVPITDRKDWHSPMSWLVRLEPTPVNGLSKLSSADAFQIRSISQQRFIRQLGELSGIEMEEIVKALKTVLDI